MRDRIPPRSVRAFRKFKAILMRTKAKRYLAAMSPDNPLNGIAMNVVGDASADPTEFFDHYDAFAYWTAKKIADSKKTKRKILDVGSPKMMCAIFSATHDVTSTVLEHCHDSISRVRYVKHDVSFPLPFPPKFFDTFTSTVALPLIGLGRYGDRLDPDCWPKLVKELDRVMTEDADLYASLCIGPNRLAFNNGWFLDIPTIQKIFINWKVADVMVDEWSSPKYDPAAESKLEKRFSGRTNTSHIRPGDYRVIFIHFVRATAA